MKQGQLAKVKRDPDRHYRYVGGQGDKECDESGRLDKHIDELDYRLEGEAKRLALVSCPKDEFEARVRARQERAERTKNAAAQMGSAQGVSANKTRLEQGEKIKGAGPD